MLHTKALYNLLRFNVHDDPSIQHEPWAVEDLRPLSENALFDRLREQGIQTDRALFLQFAERVESPEDLAEVLLADFVEKDIYDRAYLLLFDLWRRILPQRPSLSVFCDELDYQIERYDRKELQNDEPIQDILANLLEILEESADAGGEPRRLFDTVEEDCAHDIEGFLYDYISDLLEEGNTVYASELIEGFFPYMPEPIWFEILSARLLSLTDIEEANKSMVHILGQKPDLSPLLGLLRVLSKAGSRELFLEGVQQALPLLETEEDFRDLLAIVSRYYRLLDRDDLEQVIQNIMQRRESAPETLDPKDPDLQAFSSMLIAQQ